MKALVVVPTYNEVENLATITKRLFDSNPQVHLLVVDDGSPDGTGPLAEKMAETDSRIFVIHRHGKSGLGAAYRAGFEWGIAHGYEVLVEMDADGSHQPEQLPLLLAKIESADLVLGSRWVPGGQVVNWPIHRKILSIGGNFYARIMLGFRISDATGGFRAYRADSLRRMGLLEGNTQGYVFQVDSSFRAARNGLRIVEVPIIFVERTAGISKMSNRIVIEAMLQVTLWAFKHRLLRKPLI